MLWGGNDGFRTVKLMCVEVCNGSAAPFHDFRMQSFGRELVAVVGRRARTTAVANSDLLDGLCEGQVPM